MSSMKKALCLSASALTLALTLGLSQPVAAEGLVAGLGSSINGVAGAALGNNGASGALGGAGALDAALKTTDGTLKAAGVANGAASGGLFPGGLFRKGSPGILANATGALDADGKVTSIHPFGDDMVRVDLANDADAVVKGKPGNVRAVALSESDANALIRHAVPLDGIPQARSVRVNGDGTIELGAEAEAAGAKTQAKSETSASASVGANMPDALKTVKAAAGKAEDKAETVTGRLPVTAGASRDGARVAANTPRGGGAGASVTR